ncbi:uncharacterized protein N7515_003395 [Penicillium bovifimosum]|uniref:Uncharacterized protein n=1 Tax=Penicillium bovifimosum TaxID=126998 RepID=A0A9W9H4K0_9EURO|nr:uncharacterized protein N7515_003395 [Penicillium bovifimosum]KAJ5138547.1 hypothetical protein N7515_003395 [Penicillium bovifimosum]
MIANMTEWESRCKEVASDLEAEIVRVKSEAAKRAAREKAHSGALAEAMERRHAAEAGKKSGRRVGGSKRDADDIDEDDGFFDDREQGSRMDIDEAPGARAGSSRQPKRVLGRKS